jgi:hypothetical protein
VKEAVVDFVSAKALKIRKRQQRSHKRRGGNAKGKTLVKTLVFLVVCAAATTRR